MANFLTMLNINLTFEAFTFLSLLDKVKKTLRFSYKTQFLSFLKATFLIKQDENLRGWEHFRTQLD